MTLFVNSCFTTIDEIRIGIQESFQWPLAFFCSVRTAVYQIEQDFEKEQTKLEDVHRKKLEEMKVRLEADQQDRLEDMEKKHAYQMEQLRQEVDDRHAKVNHL